jgi:hypothetical protein
MAYTILPWSFERAKALGVSIAPSKNPKKKIDVFDKNGRLVASIGAMGYMDYPQYMRDYSMEYANKKRLNYKKRHDAFRHNVGTPSWYADQILW